MGVLPLDCLESDQALGLQPCLLSQWLEAPCLRHPFTPTVRAPCHHDSCVARELILTPEERPSAVGA